MKPTEKQIKSELKQYFDCARDQKCPSTMQQNLYQQLNINSSKSWWSPRFAVAGLSLLFVSSVIFNISNNHMQAILKWR
jgi:hypothetical protein